MTAAEMAEWIAFHLVEPFGAARDDERARGIMAATMAAAGARNFETSDFLKTWQPPVEQSTQDAAAAFQAHIDALSIGEP